MLKFFLSNLLICFCFFGDKLLEASAFSPERETVTVGVLDLIFNDRESYMPRPLIYSRKGLFLPEKLEEDSNRRIFRSLNREIISKKIRNLKLAYLSKRIEVSINFNQESSSGQNLLDYLYDSGNFHFLTDLIINNSIELKSSLVKKIIEDVSKRLSKRGDSFALLLAIIENSPKSLFERDLRNRYSSAPVLYLFNLDTDRSQRCLLKLLRNFGPEKSLYQSINDINDTLIHYAVRPPISTKAWFLEYLFKNHLHLFESISYHTVNLEGATPESILKSLSCYHEDKVENNFQSYKFLSKILTPSLSPTTVTFQADEEGESDIFDGWPTNHVGYTD